MSVGCRKPHIDSRRPIKILETSAPTLERPKAVESFSAKSDGFEYFVLNYSSWSEFIITYHNANSLTTVEGTGLQINTKIEIFIWLIYGCLRLASELKVLLNNWRWLCIQKPKLPKNSILFKISLVFVFKITTPNCDDLIRSVSSPVASFLTIISPCKSFHSPESNFISHNFESCYKKIEKCDGPWSTETF